MKYLVKTIRGTDCAVYAIVHHSRLPVGTATPQIEIYENRSEVKTVGSKRIQHRSRCFSIVIGTDPEMDGGITEETLRGLTHFDLDMRLQRKDGVYAPFSVYGVVDVDISPGKWVFSVDDPETVQRLLAF